MHILQNNSLVGWVLEPGSRLSYIAPTIKSITGYTSAEVLERPGIDVSPDAWEKMREFHERIFARRIDAPLEPQFFTLTMRHRDGHLVPVDCYQLAIPGKDGRIEKIVGVLEPHREHLGDLVEAWQRLGPNERQAVCALIGALAGA